ncbi:PR-1-like protein [Gymnopus androsaceus JB14]|uniref:PR-1-like protein n=1 Tax=Gymnopus androsaceus JB14 TaxID=1447944 RepID=A0A6A4GVI6_9AGAR|nr:PR-1-like protein [Gymnopus androsaceus JB14]
MVRMAREPVIWRFRSIYKTIIRFVRNTSAGNLEWNNTLASTAQQWSNNCVFEHSNGTLGPYGENIAAGTGTYNISTALGDWAAESGDYDPSNPQYSHFTQMIWKATTQLGCAVQSCNGIFPSSYRVGFVFSAYFFLQDAQFYVCEYYPQGNVIGEFS